MYAHFEGRGKLSRLNEMFLFFSGTYCGRWNYDFKFH
jgi:hypothetical protein